MSDVSNVSVVSFAVLIQIMQCLGFSGSDLQCRFINCFMTFWGLITTSAGTIMTLAPSRFIFLFLLVILLGCRRVIVKTEKAKAVEGMSNLKCYHLTS